jgi:hypothetical protein
MSDLWYEASTDHESLAREAALDHVTAELEAILPFLLAAKSDAEFGHRLALAEGRIETIAVVHDVDPSEVLDLARRRYRLMREALAEGMDPLDEVLQSTHFSGSGPEEPDSHDLGPDYSHGYSEVPQGAPGGPNPAVAQPRFPGPEPLKDAQAARHHPGYSRPKKQGSLKRQADYDATTPPDTGTGDGSQDIGVGSQEANGGQGGPPSIPAGLSQGNNGPMTVPSIGQVTSSKDPVRLQVLAVAQSVRAANPWLPEHEVMRVARTTVGRYFTRTADTDYTPTIMSDAPPVRSGGDSGDGGGGSSLAHGAEFQVGKSVAGGAGELADAAALAL